MSWMYNPCSGRVDFSQIWGQASDYQLTNEIASFVIDYSNKALSNQRPVPKSGKNPRDLNKDYASNSQTFSRQCDQIW